MSVREAMLAGSLAACLENAAREHVGDAEILSRRIQPTAVQFSVCGLTAGLDCTPNL